MSVQELRAQIIEDLQSVTDEMVLQEVLQVVQRFLPSENNIDNLHLTPSQISELERRAEAVGQGKFLTQEDVQKRRAAFWNLHNPA